MRILLTGANGYIGKRLLPELIEQGHVVVASVRDRRRMRIADHLQKHVEIVEVDYLDDSTLQNIPQDIDAAYYLIHSMGATTEEFDDMEARAASNFVKALEKTKAKQILYLGGIANAEKLSKHLESRLTVERILHQSTIPLTAFRAGIIVGSGSASFEIIRDLTEKLPFMVTPKWVSTRSKPIAVRNVVQFLIRALNRTELYQRSIDIGGPHIMSYGDMLLQYGKVRGLKRRIVHTPFLSPRLSSYWLYFVTSTNYNLAVNLVESMKVEVIPEENEVAELLDINLIPYTEAVRMAFQRIEADAVPSSWKDAYATSATAINVKERIKVPEYGCFTDRKARRYQGEINHLIDAVWSIGGETGWYYADFLWKIRGFLDKLIGGVGLRRGRTRRNEIEEGDSLDFWRVILADRESRRLLLFAEMKLPGDAWLEFEILKNDEQTHTLVQEATFRPRGIVGRMYWYLLIPFHHFVFNGMISNMVATAEGKSKNEAIDTGDS